MTWEKSFGELAVKKEIAKRPKGSDADKTEGHIFEFELIVDKKECRQELYDGDPSEHKQEVDDIDDA